jgi:hypothetical protein
LSFRALRLHGTQWQAHAPQAAQAQWQLLNLRNEAMLYETQKELLDAHHERTDTDIVVASYSMLSSRDRGHASFGVWAADVDTLLPRVDLIAFAFTRDGAKETLLVPWADACRVVGDRMETTTESPQRWRVRTFPDAAQLETLQGLVFRP